MKEKFEHTPVPNTLKIEVVKGEFPVGRKLLTNEGKEEDAEDRNLLLPENLEGVTDVPFLQYGIGSYQEDGLQYIKTEPLGACVAITLYAPKKKIGGIGHFVITNNAAEGFATILAEFEKAGIKPEEIEARIFGGSVSENKRRGEDISGNLQSQRIVEDLLSQIHMRHIPIVEYDLYGDDVRCIIMSLKDGKVFDYPYEEPSTTRNDGLIETKKLPIRSLPKLSAYHSD